MSREHKHRAWNELKKKMIYETETNFIGWGIGTNDVVKWLHFEDHDIKIGYFIGRSMQYVGFKDKNNKEIYEGDIDHYGYVVTYLANLQDGLGMNAGWYLQRDNFESWYELECNDDIEIVGNIFENTEKAINNCNTDYSQML